MSDEDYGNHILKKFRLVLSLAVIKTKPENITLEEHIQKLKNMLNVDVMEIDNLSICSDDFLFDEFNDMDVDQDNENDRNDDLLSDKNDNNTEKMLEINDGLNLNTNINKNDYEIQIPGTQNEKYDKIDNHNEINDIEMFDTQDLCESVTILENFDIGNKVTFDNTQDLNTNTDKNDDIQTSATQNERSDKIADQNDIQVFDTQDLHDSITILENFDVGNELDKLNTASKEENNLNDVKKILRENDDIIIEKTVSNKGPPTLNQDNILTQISQGIDDTQCFTDNNATQCEMEETAIVDDYIFLSQKYSYNPNYKKLNVQENMSKSSNLNSKKQKQEKIEDNNIADKLAEAVVAIGKSNAKKVYIDKDVKNHSSAGDMESKSQNDTEENDSVLIRKQKNAEIKTISLKAYRNTKEFKNIYKNVADIFGSNLNIKLSEDVKTNGSGNTKVMEKSNEAINSLNASKHITQEFTCETYYSESQKNDIISIDDKYIHGTKRNIDIQNKTAIIDSTIHKKKKEDIIFLKDTLINNCKKDIPNTKNRNDDDYISLPEIQFDTDSITRSDTNQRLNDKTLPIAATNQKMKRNRKKSTVKSVTKTKPNKIILTDSQTTNCTTPANSNQTFNQNNEDTFKNIPDTVPNTSDNNNRVKINDSKLANDETLHENDSRPHTYDSLRNSKDNMRNYNNTLLNTIDLDTNDVGIVNNNQRNLKNALNINDTENVSKILRNDQNELNANVSKNNNSDKELYAENSKHTKNIKKDQFFEQSQLLPLNTDTFQNYISDDSLGLTQKFEDFGTENQNVNKETRSKSCPVFENIFYETDKIESNTDSSQNISRNNDNATQILKNSENAKNSEKNDEKHKKICENFNTNSNTIEVLGHTNAKLDQLNNAPHGVGCTTSDDSLEELTDSEAEKIPFKIIEELCKVKMYLNRGQEINLSFRCYSSDAGYKSDCSSRNSIKMSQSSISALDQSAHSLFNYLLECHLVANTQDITEEISLVLGQLTDRLHEGETYPSFLEDILQEIQRILGQIYENDDEDMLKKEESVHRIVLLNKSIHIQKYTIDKITHILEKIHTEITTDESFEMQKIIQIENICYVFNLLESILKEHNKTTQNLCQKTQNLSHKTQNVSQKTQTLSQENQHLSHKTQNLSKKTQNLSQKKQISQDSQNLSHESEKLLKKSNIMDIWRKKWNPNYKETKNEINKNKKCVISNCSTVLNKLIVGCMEGYSLVSYFALKCFNIVQT